MKKYIAECLGTAWLVLGGCGSAVLAANFQGAGIGLLGVALAFGLTVVAMAYAIGSISGAHLNPAVSFGVWMAGKMETKDVAPYMIAQMIGGILGAGILYVIVSGNGADIGNFAANGYGEHSPGNYNMMAAMVTEVVMTFFFLLVIIGSTDAKAPAGFAGLAIGLTLTLIHLISIPVTNTSVNPARSFSQALFVGGWAISQVWLFIVMPLVGAALAAMVYKIIKSE